MEEIDLKAEKWFREQQTWSTAPKSKIKEWDLEKILETKLFEEPVLEVEGWVVVIWFTIERWFC